MIDPKIERFRYLFFNSLQKRFKARFDSGEFDRGIEAFLQGKTIILTIKTEYEGKTLTSGTKNDIVNLPLEEAIAKFDRTAIENNNPMEITDKTKK